MAAAAAAAGAFGSAEILMSSFASDCKAGQGETFVICDENDDGQTEVHQTSRDFEAIPILRLARILSYYSRRGRSSQGTKGTVRR